MENTRHDKIRKIILISLFSALAYVCMFIFRIKVSFLTFDAKDAIITVGAMLLGPIPGVIMSFTVAFLEYISVSDTGVYGFIMNFLSSATFSFVASFIYRRRKSLNTAFIALASAIIILTATMLLANIFVTPFYMLGATFATWSEKVTQIIDLLLPLLLPFNFTKALFNSSLVLVLYKPISGALHKAKLISGKENFRYNKSSIFVLILGLLMLAAAIAVFVIFLNGRFEWLKRV